MYVCAQICARVELLVERAHRASGKANVLGGMEKRIYNYAYMCVPA